MPPNPRLPSTTPLPVPYEGILDDLDNTFEVWTEGKPRRRVWAPTRVASYRNPGQPEPDGPKPSCIWFRFSQPINGRKLVESVGCLGCHVVNETNRSAAGPSVPQLPMI